MGKIRFDKSSLHIFSTRQVYALEIISVDLLYKTTIYIAISLLMLPVHMHIVVEKSKFCWATLKHRDNLIKLIIYNPTWTWKECVQVGVPYSNSQKTIQLVIP